MKLILCLLLLVASVSAEEPKELEKNRKIYLQKLQKIEKERDEKVRVLTEQYLKVLEKAKVDRTKAGDLEGALAIKKAIDNLKGIVAVPAKKPIPNESVLHKAGAAVTYNAEQRGMVRSHKASDNHIWNVRIGREVKRLRITMFIAGVEIKRGTGTSGAAHFCEVGKKEPLAKTTWSKGICMLSREKALEGSIRLFTKRSFEITDVRAGQYQLRLYNTGSGSDAKSLAVRRVEIKEL